jgi:glutaredoxin 3
MKYTTVKVYATTTCPYCKMVADWLTEKNIKFVKILVDRNDQAAMEMVHKTNQMGVPVTAIEDNDGHSEFVVGFDRPKLAKMFGV